MTRQFVIIEAPFAQAREQMGEYLRECIRDTLRRGESCMASVAIYALTGALQDTDPHERAEGIEAGLAWYAVPGIRCVAYTDHGISRGMQMGMARAQSHGVPIEVRELYAAQPCADNMAALPE